MARATRIALDMALASLNKAQPVISKVWNSGKNVVSRTAARPLVCNPVVAVSKSTRPALSTAWQYAKVECAPPGTLDFWQGPAGKKLEDAVSAAVNKFIYGIETNIKQMDAEAERIKKEKEAAIKAAQDKIKADKANQIKEAKMKALEAAKAEKASKEKAAAAKKADDAIKSESAKKPEDGKKSKDAKKTKDAKPKEKKK